MKTQKGAIQAGIKANLRRQENSQKVHKILDTYPAVMAGLVAAQKEIVRLKATLVLVRLQRDQHKEAGQKVINSILKYCSDVDGTWTAIYSAAIENLRKTVKLEDI